MPDCKLPQLLFAPVQRLTTARAARCNLACSINLYDSAQGAGQCDALIAAGSLSCTGNLAEGGDYAG